MLKDSDFANNDTVAHRELEHLETKVESGTSQEGLAPWPNNSALDEKFLA